MGNINIKNYIYSYDLRFIATQLESNNWNEEEIALAIKTYKNYIYLRYKHKNLDLVPSYEIDVIWRYHILETKKYREFCENIFDGQYLDRSVNLKRVWENENIKLQFERVTQKLYFEEFGVIIPTIVGGNYWTEFLRLLRHVWAKWLTATVIITTLGTAYGIVSSHDNQLNSAYLALKSSIRNISYDAEESYLLCHSDLKEKYPNFYIKALYESHISRRKHYANFINIVLDLKQDNQLSKSALGKLTVFSNRTNRLYLAGLNVCPLNLMGIKETERDRKSLNQFIWKSREEYLWL